ncbi:MAG TPA: hypothetical protein VGP99_13695 [Tepidisphaeraceae bacterium]|jgi:hypothetical protein|nr:hypothetical protein [Tepidisphaeraceae bacterium]
MRFVILFFAVLFALAQQAGGDNPAPDNWPKTVEAFGTALSDNDAGALLAVLGEDVSITTFDTKNGDAIRLLARTKKGALIKSFSYVHAPEAMASDVAGAFKDAEVPEELKRKMAMRDDAHARRANRTAATWLTESLGAKQGDKVGVLMFWCDKSANGEAEVVFILVKGEPESEFAKIKAICYGNPLPRSSK